MAPRGRTALIAIVWAGLIGLCGAYIHATLRVSSDLRLFLPTPRTRAERLILEEVSEGPASRLLMVALRSAGSELTAAAEQDAGAERATGAERAAGAMQDRETEQLAETSRRLAGALRSDPAFALVANGENPLSAIPSALLPYRYLLSPTLDRARLDADYLREQLIERERDLSSPAADLLEPWLPRDPTLETLKVLESWQPPHEPQLIDGVWFDARGRAALLVVETAAAAFDPQAQRVAMQKLRSHFAAARAAPSVQLDVTGPGAFSVLMQSRSEADARLAGILDTAGMILLMLLAYRSALYVVLGALPLATAGIVALVAVTALFGTVHGITIAFGFTLIGVAVDYPIFVFSHQLPGVSSAETARSIWSTLAIAVIGLCIAYLAFLLSGVAGLAQLACFNVAGLAAAGLSTRYLLPQLLPAGARDHGDSRLPARLATLSARLPRLPWLMPALALASVAALVVLPGPLWENDLGKLTPVPPPLLRQYATLQQELGQPDVRYLMTVDGSTAEQVLAREEGLAGGLERLIASRAVSGFQDAARYLPSASIQERRQAALPDDAALRAALDAALRGTAFRPGLFEPFLADVARARRLPPLTVQNVAGTPLELSIGSLLLERGGSWTGLVTFTDVQDPAAVSRLVASSGGTARLLDLKQASEGLVAHQRLRILWSIAAAAVLLALVVYVALRSARRTLRVLAPMALTTLLTLAALHAAGVTLNLFHLIALVLAAGLGLDYGLFFERSAHDPVGRRRTLHALLVCATAACIVFAVLASSALPVLRSIGVTVVMGVIGNFGLALVTIRSERSPACSDTTPSPR